MKILNILLIVVLSLFLVSCDVDTLEGVDDSGDSAEDIQEEDLEDFENMVDDLNLEDFDELGDEFDI